MESERSNLIALARLAVHEVLQIANDKHQILIRPIPSKLLNKGESFVQTSHCVQRLLVVIEHCLCHGLRGNPDDSFSALESGKAKIGQDNRSLLQRAKDQVLSVANTWITPIDKPDPWPVLLLLEKTCCFSDSGQISRTISSMNEICTGLGKTRVWIRQALMKKQLGDYFNHLIDLYSNQTSNESFGTGENGSSFYHSEALLLNDEGIVFVGLLGGLSSVDFCFDLKENLHEMDQELLPPPYSYYLQPHTDQKLQQQSTDTDDKYLLITNQKLYLEEQNKQLRQRVDLTVNLLEKETTKTFDLKKRIEDLTLEKQSLRITIDQLKEDMAKTTIGVRENFKTPIIYGSTEEIFCPVCADRISELNSRVQTLTAKMDEKKILIDSLQEQLAEIRVSRDKINHLLLNAKTLCSQKQDLIRQLEGKSKSGEQILFQMKERIATLTTEKDASVRSSEQLESQTKALQHRCAEQQSKLDAQQQLIGRLECQLEQLKAETAKLRVSSDEYDDCKKKLQEVMDEASHWRTLCGEQETSMTAMATIVNSSKLETEQLRESHEVLKNAQWMSDNAVANCHLCMSEFTISLRRHHCRNCGHIFCYACSSHSMKLVSSSKPVRVCDTCHDLLLCRYSAR